MQYCVGHRSFHVRFIRFLPHHNRCRRDERIRRRRVRCAGRWRKASKCSRSCDRRIVHFHRFAHRCRCVVRRIVRKLKCCCPKPGKPVTRCWHDGRTLLTSWTEHRLWHHNCVPIQRRRSRKVRCRRRAPQVSFSPCVRGFRTITIRHFLPASSCRCRVRRSVRKERCGCPSRSRVHRGRCHGKFAVDTWSEMRFESSTKKCKWVIARHIKRRCRCPPMSRRVRCLNHTLRVIETVSFRLLKNSCVRLQRRKLLPTRCKLVPRLLWKRRSGGCTLRHGFQVTIRRRFEMARHCRCRKFVRVQRQKCDCRKALRKKTTKLCEGKDRIVLLLLTPARIKKTCGYHQHRVVKKIRCSGLRLLRGPCRSSFRSVKVLRRLPSRCRCRWRQVGLRKERCRCPPTRRTRRCEGHRWRHEVIVFRLSHGRCLRRRRRRFVSVPCRQGTVRRQSACDRVSGLRKVTWIRRRLKGCRCHVTKKQRFCSCACRTGRQLVRCKHRLGLKVVVQLRRRLVRCRCVRERKIRAFRTICPRAVRKAVACKFAGHQKDAKKELRVVWFVRDGCRCQRMIRKKSVLCYCAARPVVRKICAGDSVIVRGSRRVLRAGKCRRVWFEKSRQRIRCPKTRKTVSCHKVTGVEVLEVHSSILRHCRCIPHVRRIKRRCKCDSTPRLVRRSKCSRASCLQLLTFRILQLVKKACKARQFSRSRRCCCRTPHRTSSRCIARTGEVETRVKRVRLRGGECVPKTRFSRRKIHCAKSLQRKTVRQKNGLEITRVTWHQRVACKCQKFSKTLVRRWRCSPPSSTSGCVSGSKEVRIVSFSLLRGRCVRRLKVRSSPVLCPPNRRSIGKCLLLPRRYGYFRRISVHRFRKDHRCRCVQRLVHLLRLCRCWKTRERQLCRKGQHMRIREIFVPSSDRRSCHRKRTVRRWRTRCGGKWRRRVSRCDRTSGQRLILFERRRSRNCRCVTERRKRVCRCACPRMHHFIRCRENRIWEHYVTRHRLNKCRCFSRKTLKQHRVTCRKERKIRMACSRSRGCVQKELRVFYVLRNCRCVRHVTRRFRKCCCPAPRMRRRCDAISGKRHHVTESWRLVGGRCIRFVKKRARQTVCSRRTRIISRGPCIKGKRKVKTQRSVRRGCRCTLRNGAHFERCALRPCPKSSRHVLPCERSCEQKILLTSFHRLGNSSCGKLRKVLRRRCCCSRKPLRRTLCIRDRRFLLLTTWSFDRRRRICVRKSSRREFALRCRPPTERRSACGRDGFRRMWRRESVLRKCRCWPKTRVFRRRCRCPKSRRKKSCRGHSTVLNTIVSFELRGKHCLRHVKIEKKAIRCQRPREIVGKCNRHSCRRTVATISFVAKRCRCRRLVRKWRVKCCCRSIPHSYRVCHDNNRRVFVRQWKVFDHERRQCVTKRKHTTKRVECPTEPRTKMGTCGVKRGITIYRLVTKHKWRVAACRCRRLVKTRQEPCGCARSFAKRFCREGRVMRLRVFFRIDRSLGRCRRYEAKSLMRTVVCNPKKLFSLGPCTVRGPSGHFHRRVVLRWRERRGCRCQWRRGVQLRLCSCRGPRVERRCRRGVLLRREISFARQDAKCRAYARTSHRLVKCPLPRRAVGPCVGGVRRITEQFFRLSSTCRCERKSRVQLQKCVKCSAKRLHFRAASACLAVDRLHHRFHLATLRRLSYWSCRETCERRARCKSFDFYVARHTGDCVLSSATRHEVSGGAGKADLVRHKASKCIHARKICLKKCPALLVRHLEPCRCLKKPHGGSVAHCLRRSEVLFFQAGEKGSCERRKWRGFVPCGPRSCDDREAPGLCRRRRQKGQCRLPVVFKRCKRSCGRCRCHGVELSRTPCAKDGHRTVYAVRYRRHEAHGQCVITYKKWQQRCAYCVLGTRVKVHPCRKGWRVVEKIETKAKGHGCAVRRHRRVERCEGCDLSDRMLIGACGPSGRRVELRYFVRRNGCCRLQRLVQHFACRGCRADAVRSTKCFGGARLRQIVYSVRLGAKCFQKVFSRQEACQSENRFECEDKLSRSECIHLRQESKCKFIDTRKLCRRTCQLC